MGISAQAKRVAAQREATASRERIARERLELDRRRLESGLVTQQELSKERAERLAIDKRKAKIAEGLTRTQREATASRTRREEEAAERKQIRVEDIQGLVDILAIGEGSPGFEGALTRLQSLDPAAASAISQRQIGLRREQRQEDLVAERFAQQESLRQQKENLISRLGRPVEAAPGPQLLPDGGAPQLDLQSLIAGTAPPSISPTDVGILNQLAILDPALAAQVERTFMRQRGIPEAGVAQPTAPTKAPGPAPLSPETAQLLPDRGSVVGALAGAAQTAQEQIAATQERFSKVSSELEAAMAAAPGSASDIERALSSAEADKIFATERALTEAAFDPDTGQLSGPLLLRLRGEENPLTFVLNRLGEIAFERRADRRTRSTLKQELLRSVRLDEELRKLREKKKKRKGK